MKLQSVLLFISERAGVSLMTRPNLTETLQPFIEIPSANRVRNSQINGSKNSFKGVFFTPLHIPTIIGSTFGNSINVIDKRTCNQKYLNFSVYTYIQHIPCIADNIGQNWVLEDPKRARPSKLKSRVIEISHFISKKTLSKHLERPRYHSFPSLKN